MVCTFFGHRTAPDSIRPILHNTLTHLIEKGVDTFYVGNQGNFDAMARRLLSDLSEEYPITFTVVLAYLPKEKTDDPERTIYPEGLENVPPRFAVSYRNKWMLERADVVITYVSRSFGGAAKYKDLAGKRGKNVIEVSAADE